MGHKTGERAAARRRASTQAALQASEPRPEPEAWGLAGQAAGMASAGRAWSSSGRDAQPCGSGCPERFGGPGCSEAGPGPRGVGPGAVGEAVRGGACRGAGPPQHLAGRAGWKAPFVMGACPLEAGLGCGGRVQ